LSECEPRHFQRASSHDAYEQLRLNFKGHQVKDDEILEIVVNQYRAVGGGNYPMFSADKIVREITVDMTELIADYLKKHPIIEASVNHNFTVLK
jgi:2',3'-cyclic-nucleotide 2'-phosphodiesterase / 3'-nucleotidase